MPKFTVTSPLQHDGKAYGPAAAVRRPRAAAEPAPAPEPAPEPSEPPPADPATPE